MSTLGAEIQAFSRDRLKKQCTRVTTVTGRRLVERRRGGEEEEVVEEVEEESAACGYVEDTRLDLQIGVVRPFLLLGSQDAAHDMDTLHKHQVTHVLNVSYGVPNLFPDQLVYRTVTILDLPESDITSCLEDCCSFIDHAMQESGVVLVHCNAGVSRSASVVIGHLMLREGLPFSEAYRQVKQARPSVCPNSGFYRQLQDYKP